MIICFDTAAEATVQPGLASKLEFAFISIKYGKQTDEHVARKVFKMILENVQKGSVALQAG